MITVVGLGVNAGDLTEQGKQAILAAADAGKPIVCRTAKAKSYINLATLGVAHTSLDKVYESSRSFTSLNRNLANAVHALGDGTVYCVDGAASEDNSVKLLSKKRGGVKIIGGVSKISDFAARAAFFGCSYTAVSAYELIERAKAGGLKAPLIVYDVTGVQTCALPISYASSTTFILILSGVCALSQGQPPGARKRQTISCRSSSVNRFF